MNQDFLQKLHYGNVDPSMFPAIAQRIAGNGPIPDEAIFLSDKLPTQQDIEWAKNLEPFISLDSE